MQLPSLLSILQQKQLFFVAISHVRDPYDGDLPKAVKNRYWDWAGFSPQDYESPPGSFGDHVENVIRKSTCINCWHVNSVESAAMWSLYSSHGVAIKSTVKRLINAVGSTREEVRIGAVQYVDFHAPKMKEAERCLFEVVVKRKSFDHEKELRAITFDLDVMNGKKRGKFVDVDVSELIETVYISPIVEDWIKDIVGQELKVHGLPDVSVKHSPLYSKDLK